MNLRHFSLVILCLAPMGQGNLSANNKHLSTATQLMSKGLVLKTIYNAIIKKDLNNLSYDILRHLAMYGLMIFAIIHSDLYREKKDQVTANIWFCAAITAYITAQTLGITVHNKKLAYSLFVEIAIKSFVPLYLQFNKATPTILFI